MSTSAENYRIYCYDNARRIVTSDWIKAETDEQAVARAKQQGFGTRCEVWHGDRLVAELADERRTA